MIIALLSGKGGVGKTTILANLGKELSKEPSRVLLVDSDFFTQGLSFSMAKGKYSFGFSLEDIISNRGQTVLEPSEETMFFKISPGLYLLPSLKGSFDSRTARRIEDNLRGRLRELRKVLKTIKETYGFDYILIDTRSGSSFLSVFPALVSDEFWVVTEEDIVSQEISNVLIKMIHEYADEEKMETTLGAFLVNKSLITSVAEAQALIAFFERNVFRARCESIISLNVKVRRAFLDQKFPIDAYPSSVFSGEIRALSGKLTNRYVLPILDRLKSYRGSRRIIGVVYPLMSVFGIVSLAVGFVSFFLSMGLNVDMIAGIPYLMLAMGLAGAGAILITWKMRAE